MDKALLLRELAKLREEEVTDNLGSEDYILPEIFEQAKFFIEHKIPNKCVTPIVSKTHKGEVEFYWTASEYRRIAIHIGRTRLTFSGIVPNPMDEFKLDTDVYGNGKNQMGNFGINDRLPDSFVNLVNELFPCDNKFDLKKALDSVFACAELAKNEDCPVNCDAPVSAKTIGHMVNFLDKIPCHALAPYIGLTGTGGLYLVWEKPNTHLKIYIKDELTVWELDDTQGGKIDIDPCVPTLPAEILNPILARFCITPPQVEK